MTDPIFLPDELPKTKTVTRDIPAGKYRVGFDPKYAVENVRLIDIRKRKWPLNRATEPKEIYDRCTKDPEGKVVEAAMLRGLPSMYAVEGPNVVLWPSPLHDWTIEADLVRRK